MNLDLVPTTEGLRRALVDRVDRFVELAHTSRSAIGRAAVGDGKIVHRIAKGSNFTAETYDKLIAWLDENWPHEEEKTAAAE